MSGGRWAVSTARFLLERAAQGMPCPGPGLIGEVCMEPIVADVLDAVARDDRAALVRLLHPYLHWTESGTTIRGRNHVFARLAAKPAPEPPASIELRDGQIYRWTDR